MKLVIVEVELDAKLYLSSDALQPLAEKRHVTELCRC